MRVRAKLGRRSKFASWCHADLVIPHGRMQPNLYLINDDEPRQFTARRLTIIRDDVRVDQKPGIVVRIDPPIDQAAGGPLATALLVPRHRDIGIQDLRQGRMPKPVSVFVCRLRGEPHELGGELTGNDVSIAFWGLVNNVLDSGR